MIEVLVLIAGSAAALDAARTCSEIAADAARLACYDSLFRDAGSYSPDSLAETAGEAASSPAQTVVLDSEETFGLTEAQRAQRAAEAGLKPVDEITVTIISLNSDHGGKLVIELANGQRWRQVDSTGWTGFRVGETIVIRRGALGSYLATAPDSGRPAVRVRRDR